MLKIITGFIRDFVDRLAYTAEKDSLYDAADKSLKILDPKSEKEKNINNTVTFAIDDLQALKRGIGILANNFPRKVDIRIEGLEKVPGAKEGGAVKIYEDIKTLYDEAIDAGEKAIRAKGDERNTLLNIVTKNAILVKNLLKKNENMLKKYLP